MAGDQALEVSKSGLPKNNPGAVTKTRNPGDALVLYDLPDHLSYRAIHDTVKPFGDVLRICRIYDVDGPENRCYILFNNPKEASAAL